MIHILYYIKTRIRTHLTTSHFQDKQQRWAVPENQAQLVWAESDLDRPLVMAGCWHGPVHYCSSPWLWKGLGSESHLTLTWFDMANHMLSPFQWIQWPICAFCARWPKCTNRNWWWRCGSWANRSRPSKSWQSAPETARGWDTRMHLRICTWCMCITHTYI